MKNLNKTLLLFILFFVVTSTCVITYGEAVDSNKPVELKKLEAKTEGEPKTEAKAGPKPDRLLATVNGKKIMRSEIDAMILERVPNISSLPEMIREGYFVKIRPQALDGYIVEMLLEDELEAQKIVVADSEIMAKIEEIAIQNNMSLEQLEEKLKSVKKDIASLKKDVEKNLKYEKLFSNFAGDISVSDEDVQKHYEENKSEFDVKEQVRASHILVKFDHNATDEQKAEAKKKIEDILAKVKAGEDFAELAKQYSDCPSGKNNEGDLGFFTRDKMVKPFSDAAFSMNVGDVSDIVETNFGYHIIKVTDKTEASERTFEDVKEEIKSNLERQKRSQSSTEYVEQLKKRAKIEYNEELNEAEKAPKEPKEVKVEK